MTYQAIKKIRDVSSWAALVMIASLLMAEKFLSSRFVYPYNPNEPPPAWALNWRLGSVCLLLVLSLISLPRWQSILGLLTLVLFVYYLQSY
jgi:hypothetical protein